MNRFLFTLLLVASVSIPCFGQDSSLYSKDSTELIDRVISYRSMSVNILTTGTGQSFQYLVGLASKNSQANTDAISLFLDVSCAANYPYAMQNGIALGGALLGGTDSEAGMASLLAGYKISSKELFLGFRVNFVSRWMEKRHINLELDFKQSKYNAWGYANLDAQLLKISEPLLLGVSFRGIVANGDNKSSHMDLISCLQVYYESRGNKRASFWCGVGAIKKEIIAGGSFTL